MTVITDINEVLRKKKKKKGWKVVTDNELLLSFFQSGDYHLWVGIEADGRSVEDVCGANVMEWEIIGDEVHFYSSIMEDEDTPVEDWEVCKIKRDVLSDVINKTMTDGASWGQWGK